MENIAAVRPQMAVLDKNKLMLSPFGALSHALAEEILARTGQAEGGYPYVPLELMTEPEEGPEEKKEEPAVNVEVKLTLELTQEARELRERTETVERILERIERIRERGEASQMPRSRERDTAQPAESRSFFQNINQHISFPMTLSVPDTAGTAQPGGIARISEKFANTLRTMREEGIYREPGGETQRVADVGRGDAKIAEGEAAGSGTAGSGAASGELGRAAVDRTVTTGATELSGADFAVRAAETELNTSGMNEKSPETAARAAERIGEKIAESAAREIAEKFDELAKREAQADGGAVTGRDGGTSAAARNVDSERGQGVRDNDRGQDAHGDMATGRTSRTRRRGTHNRENPEITEGADREKAYAARTETQDGTVGGADGSVGASSESRREVAGIESEDRPVRAVPVLKEDMSAAPEELTLAADVRSESGDETFMVGRETREDTRRAHVKEDRAKMEHENGTASRRAGKNRAQGEADGNTADTAGGTGTVEMAEGRTVVGETEKPGISQNAGEGETASRSGHDRERAGTEAPEEAAVSREELTEELPRRAGSVAAPESEVRGADSGYRTGAEAIPLRGESEIPVPEELTLSSAAERSGEMSPTVDRQTIVDGGRAADREKNTVESDRKNLTHMTGAADVDTTDEEATVRGAGRVGRGTKSWESAGDTDRTETGMETDHVRETGKSGELRTAERNAPKVGTAEGGDAGRGERTVEAIPERERPYMLAPEELALWKEETAAPEGGSHNVGEVQDEIDGRKVKGARDAGESYDVRETHDAGETHDAVEGREVRKARDAVESYDTGAAEAIPLRGEFVEVTPEELALARAEETAKPDGRTGDTVHDAAADEKRDTHPHSGETVHIDGKTDRQGRASATTIEDGGEVRDRDWRAAENTGRAGKTGEFRAAEGEAAKVGETGRVERTAEAIPEMERSYTPALEELAFRKEETAAPESGETGRVERTVEAIPERERPYVPAPEELAFRNEETVAPESRETGRAERTSEAIPEREGPYVPAPEELAFRKEETAVPEGRETERAERAAEAIPERERPYVPTPEELAFRKEETAVPEGRETGRTERPVEAIPDHGKPYVPTPEELALRNEETAAPEGEPQNVGEAQKEVERRKVRETRDAGEIYDVTEARNAREVHGAVKGRNVREAHDAGEIYDAGTARDTAAEAIPLRGEFVEVTPEELALAQSEEAARPDLGRTGDAARGAATGEKRNIYPHSGENVHIDGKTGRQGRASATIKEDGGEETGETGRTSERTGRAGKTGELRTAEGEAARSGTAKVGEIGRAERTVEAIPERERPNMPVPEELALRNEKTTAPEGGAILSPGSTAKSVEAFAESIAEKARRAERAGIRAVDGNRSMASADRSGTEAGIPRRGSAQGAGTVGFPPPVELIGATEGERDAGIAGTEAERGTRTERTSGIREHGDTAPRLGAVSADGTDNVTGRETRRARRTAERASGGSAAAGPAPVELAYGGTGDARTDEQSRTQPAGSVAESEYVKSLPDWARRFLKEGAGSLGTAGSMAVTSIPDTGKTQNKKPQMMEWTAPGYQPTPPAETQFKELRPPEDTGGQTGEVHISDAEIRRTADRVYKMIEDRIRRERRRLGL